MLPPYRKPHLDISGQIALLRSRGMIIADLAKAASYLERVGYYRLSGYWYPLRQSRIVHDVGRKITTQVRDDFRAGTSFGQAVDLYVFDKRLRLLFLDAIERSRWRCAWRSRSCSVRGVRGLTAKQCTCPAASPGERTPRRDKRHTRSGWPVSISSLLVPKMSSSATLPRYSGPLPIWIAIELWDFGMLSTFLAGMAVADQTLIGAKYGVGRPKLLTGWMRGINLVRNICAHHGRLWNRSLADQPKPPKSGELPLLDHLATDALAQSRLYGVAAPMQFLLRTINPTTTWSTRLRDQLAAFPAAPGAAIAHSGFPAGWDTLPLWIGSRGKP